VSPGPRKALSCARHPRPEGRAPAPGGLKRSGIHQMAIEVGIIGPAFHEHRAPAAVANAEVAAVRAAEADQEGVSLDRFRLDTGYAEIVVKSGFESKTFSVLLRGPTGCITVSVRSMA